MKLLIKTITEKIEYAESFDEKVNDAISEGWDMTDHQVIVSGSNILLYAQLSRYEDNEEEYEENTATWTTTRDPRHPFRCSGCNSSIEISDINSLPSECPKCGAVML